jgi:hypothetical protein
MDTINIDIINQPTDEVSGLRQICVASHAQCKGGGKRKVNLTNYLTIMQATNCSKAATGMDNNSQLTGSRLK